LKIRPVCIETDLPAIADNYSVYERNKNILAEEVRSFLENTASGRIAQMFVAVDENNAIQGHVEISHEIWHTAGQFILFILVDPKYCRQMIGSSLWEASLDFLKGHAVTSLISSVWDDEPAGLAFARRRGFEIQQHIFASHLDLNTFDESPYLSDIDRLEKEGIRFCTLADFPEDEETTQRFYELNLAVVRDIPGEDWDLSEYPEFFKKHVLGSAWFRREDRLLAVAGDEWVGFASVNYNPATCRAYNATTGVIRPYRGRKIAQALKALAVRYARRQGATTVDTDNDSLNAPMLAVNRKFGYQPQPGKYKLVRQM
jgi:GNAT superfamily N-acetyltransferase